MGRDKPFRVPLHRILLLPPVPAGMDLAVLGGLVALMRKTSQDPPPALVRAIGRVAGHKVYRLVDGRHRFFGAVIAGRRDLLCVEDEHDD